MSGSRCSRLAAVEALLYLEADLLDRKQLSDWCALYTEDCVFWIPAWDSEEELVTDPEISVNMMYLVGKPALEARLHRIESSDAYASMPLARTAHSVTNIRITAVDDDELAVSARWTVLSLEPRRGKTWLGGWYEYALRRSDTGLKIRQKKIVLLEDVIDGTIDIYQV